MTRNWHVIGAVGFAAALMYTYVNRVMTRVEKANEGLKTLGEMYVPKKLESLEDILPKHYPLPTDEDKAKGIKEETKTRQGPAKLYQKKEETLKNRAGRLPLPRYPDSAETITEEDKERRWYDLSAEERELETREDMIHNFNSALEEGDYKAAESYIKNLIDDSADLDETRQELKRALSSAIISNYNIYLDKIIEDCDSYDYDSVFRKVMWVNFFAAENEEIFPISIPFSDYDPEKDLDLMALLEKGDRVLSIVEDCK